MRKIGNKQFNFPTGDSIYQSNCSISGFNSAFDTVTAQYFHTNPTTTGYDTGRREKSLTNISGKEYWKIDYSRGNVASRTNVAGPTPPTQITLSYDSAHSDPVSSIYSLRVAHWNGTEWENRGGGGVIGNRRLAFVTSTGPETNFGIFTLGAVPYHLPLITVGKIDSIACNKNFLRIPFTVDSELFVNNQFIAQLSDSSGSFAHPANIGYSNTNVNHSDTISASLPNNPSPTADYKIRVVATSPSDTSVNTRSLRIKTVPIVQFKILGPNPGCISSVPAKYYTSLKRSRHCYKICMGNLSGGNYCINPC